VGAGGLRLAGGGRLQVARFGDGLAVADASPSVVEGLLAD